MPHRGRKLVEEPDLTPCDPPPCLGEWESCLSSHRLNGKLIWPGAPAGALREGRARDQAVVTPSETCVSRMGELRPKRGSGMDQALFDKIRRAAERSIRAPGEAGRPLPKDTPKLGENFIVVFRHGESEDNRNRAFSGWRDSPLTDVGREQAGALAAQLRELRLDLVITSDQSRSKETARLALVDHPRIKWEEDWRVKERDYGDLAGQSKEEWMLKDPERAVLWRRGYDVAPPNGESLKAVEERVWPFLDALVERIRRERINVALSAHGNSMRAIRRYFEHMDIEGALTHENPLGTDYALYVVR